MTNFGTFATLLVKLNAPLPLSAAAERLFSSGLIMSHKITELTVTDKHFENLVFLKANQWLAD